MNSRATRLLFSLTAFVATVFIITILAMVAMLLGDPEAPVNVWFNRHGGTVLVIQVLAIIGLGLAAMTVDRRETLRALREAAERAATDDKSSIPPTMPPTVTTVSSGEPESPN